MKKYIISSFVIVSFFAYSFYQRAFGMHNTPVITPSRLSQNIPTVTSTPIPTSTTTIIPTALPAKRKPSKTQTIPTATPSPTQTPTAAPVVASGYKDGTYTGDPADAFYGTIQVQATISGGKLANVQFLQSPNDRGTSIEINQQADPMLAQEAIQAQSAQVDIISGATDSSQAFIQSLQSALNKAKS